MDYRGEWKVKFRAVSNTNVVPFQIGDRVAQIYFEAITPVQFVITDKLSNTDRGEGGFGSTGVK